MIDPAEQTYNESRAGQVRHTLVWITARNRDTGAAESMGLWTGDDHQTFTIGGEARLYFGAGAAIDVDDIEGGVGLEVRYLRARLATVPEVEQLIRGYDPKLAPVEVHTAVFSLTTNALVAPPRRIFLGTVNETPIVTPAEGGVGSIEIVAASAARALTRTLPLYRSDAAMRLRNEDDRFREYVTPAGLWEVPWGEGKVRAPSSDGTDSPSGGADDSAIWGP